MDRFVFLTVDGLAHGAVYAAFALALVLIWRGTRVVNFAQGAMAVAAAYIAFSVTTATGSLLARRCSPPSAGRAGARRGRRAGVMAGRGLSTPLTAIVVALGLALVIQAVLGMIYGVDDRPFPVPFSRRRDVSRRRGPALAVRHVRASCVVVLILVGIGLLFTRTPIGLRMRAAAFAPETARLLGVNVAPGADPRLGARRGGRRAREPAHRPDRLLNPTAMDLVFVSAFTAAVDRRAGQPGRRGRRRPRARLVLSYASGYLRRRHHLARRAPGAARVVLLVRPDGPVQHARAARRV